MKKRYFLPLSILILTAAGSFFMTRQISQSPATRIVQLSPDTAVGDITIRPGDKLVFQAADGYKHNLIQDHDHHSGGIESGEFEAGEAFEAKFNRAGVFFLYDKLHPKIEINVIVSNS